jgi:hypothetical protein
MRRKQKKTKQIGQRKEWKKREQNDAEKEK